MYHLNDFPTKEEEKNKTNINGIYLFADQITNMKTNLKLF
jgi:hypothetical protein